MLISNAPSSENPRLNGLFKSQLAPSGKIVSNRDQPLARQSGGIIFTTVQKFSLLEGEKAHPPLCTRTNVVVISDEAHRSQYGLKAKLNQKTGKFGFGYAKQSSISSSNHDLSDARTAEDKSAESSSVNKSAKVVLVSQ